MTDFIGWGKTARLFRDITITEKIDGTNAQIVVTSLENDPYEDGQSVMVATGEGLYKVRAGSRTRFVTPENDNFGFASWVWEHADQLVKLGEGRHFGEWWGAGIQRKYGLKHKVFSLFNTSKWHYDLDRQLPYVPGLTTVPVLYNGPFSEYEIRAAADRLHSAGSTAARYQGVEWEGEPEGICIYHKQANQVFKYTPYEKEDGHKG